MDSQVQFLEGWFKNTLPAAPIERLAIMRLDGDDYMLKPCAQAVREFREQRRIVDEIQSFDDFRAFWRRSA
jgi:hypothetical protein